MMHVVLGGTGQVGSAVARALLNRGEPVTIVTRNAGHGKELHDAGAAVAVVDVRDVEALRKVFRAGRRAFLLNPPASPTTDTDAEERASAAAIVEALEGSGLEKVIAASTYGARRGERCGDLTVLHEFEQRLKAQSIPAAINRGAYYMSNWAEMLDVVRESKALPSFFPANMTIPMVAPQDLGEAAARRLLEPVEECGLHYVEGPEGYSPRDVADAFSEALSQKVDVMVTPREEWTATFLRIGFSPAAAESYARMTGTVIADGPEKPVEPERGRVTLRKYILDIMCESKQ